MLGHGFACSKAARDGCASAFCYREQHIDDAEACDERLVGNLLFCEFAGGADRPP